MKIEKEMIMSFENFNSLSNDIIELAKGIFPDKVIYINLLNKKKQVTLKVSKHDTKLNILEGDTIPIENAICSNIDLLNSFISMILGILLGQLFLISRLNTLEMKRLLTIEKETDFLTGLSNRRKLYDKYKTFSCDLEATIGVLMIDIDYFKDYNDKYGHIMGDACLVEIANYLALLIKDYEVNFYRFGGEEFVGIVKVKNMQELIEFAEKIRVDVSNLEIPNEKRTVSIGLSLCDYSCYEKMEELIDKADKALYKAKKAGRNRVEFLD